MEWWEIAQIALVVIVLYGVGMLIRNQMVFKLRGRLLREEGDWLQQHLAELADGRRQGIFERYKRLPSYGVMVLKFWRTMGSFERELGSIEQYYPLMEGNER